MLAGDSRAALDKAETFIPDRRAIHFWDEEKIAGRWFAKAYGDADRDVVWDAYSLYDPQVVWGETPPPVLNWGGPVINTFDNLQTGLSMVWGN